MVDSSREKSPDSKSRLLSEKVPKFEIVKTGEGKQKGPYHRCRTSTIKTLRNFKRKMEKSTTTLLKYGSIVKKHDLKDKFIDHTKYRD